MQRILGLINRRILGIAVAAELLVLGVGFAIVGLSPSDTEQNVVLVSGLAVSFVAMVVAMDREFRRRDRCARGAGAMGDPDK